MICYESEFARIDFLESEKSICCNWVGEVKSSDFQEVMLLKVNAIQHYKAKSWIIDIRHMGALGLADQQWMLDTWIKLFEDVTLAKVAIIKSFEIYNDMVIESFLKEVEKSFPVEIQLFTDMESARCWVQEKRETNMLVA